MSIDVYARDAREAHLLANRAGRIFLCELNEAEDGAWIVRLHVARSTDFPVELAGSTTAAIALVERWLAESGRMTTRAAVEGRELVIHAFQPTAEPAA
jgi:hypothetical protein